ncbi:dopamine beta hydroxylase [Anopheles darlingi]|uniref:Dopamine beta hydroxylase n=1 Tax=Anopheles darlingi TaxID=43151 RepID=W5JGJ1_ANODA|nr:dopamine beta hydroxylase [Anopheles darlingi]
MGSRGHVNDVRGGVRWCWWLHIDGLRVLLSVLVLCGLCVAGSGAAAAGPQPQWDHLVDFDPNYRLLWTVGSQEITFEIQARTLGYVGLGFSKDGTLSGADIAIGWIDQGHVYLQDLSESRSVASSHCKRRNETQ